MLKIGLDVMGGDEFPAPQIAGALAARPLLDPDVVTVLIGDRTLIENEFRRLGVNPNGFEIVHASDYITMSDHPTQAFLRKPDSTIGAGIREIKAGTLDAFVSAGNTGAMLAASVIGLGVLEGLLRPTVGALYPLENRYSLLCDVGANVDCKPEHLAQFGLLGSVFVETVLGYERPRVALLNVGEEKTKGNHVVRQAYELMSQDPKINFVGNAEGHDMVRGVADVYVCDGFVGNILLKFGESFYPFLKSRLPHDAAVESFNFEAVGGLPILGVNGYMIVGHGRSGPEAYKNMLLRAQAAVRSGLSGKIAAAIRPA
ncbi:MAG: phosphate--acyl-ACP acyltransferase [Bacteroidia bacterium]|nr:phosphate acyltransferase [Bacteroidia bacterium]MDW8334725.1 phosphate--acyl-ACP acyltransferase [Bacteroidia bacterium]